MTAQRNEVERVAVPGGQKPANYDVHVWRGNDCTWMARLRWTQHDGKQRSCTMTLQAFRAGFFPDSTGLAAAFESQS